MVVRGAVFSMSVTVKYFASLRELTGRPEARVELEGGESAAQLWRRANPGLELPAHALVAVNLEQVPLSHPVRDGDEVAYFPPVTGG